MQKQNIIIVILLGLLFAWLASSWSADRSEQSNATSSEFGALVGGKTELLQSSAAQIAKKTFSMVSEAFAGLNADRWRDRIDSSLNSHLSVAETGDANAQNLVAKIDDLE